MNIYRTFLKISVRMFTSETTQSVQMNWIDLMVKNINFFLKMCWTRNPNEYVRSPQTTNQNGGYLALEKLYWRTVVDWLQAKQSFHATPMNDLTMEILHFISDSPKQLHFLLWVSIVWCDFSSSAGTSYTTFIRNRTVKCWHGKQSEYYSWFHTTSALLVQEFFE